MSLSTHKEASAMQAAGRMLQGLTQHRGWWGLMELPYLGVCLSQRGSCIHQELADGAVALAGCLVQCCLTPRPKHRKQP